MKEIWDLAISGQVLPFTLLLIPVALYWILAMLGTLDLEFLHMDFDSDVDVDVDVDADVSPDVSADATHGPFMGVFQGALRMVNATDVPLMIVLSIMFLMAWMCAMLGNLWFNAGLARRRGAYCASALWRSG